MISSEVQRTLVKSPPELWAELSDADALARHLGDLGDLAPIHITRTEPERKIEWQAGPTSGTVVLKPSGWGTKVTLSVTRELRASAAPVTAAPAPSEELAPNEPKAPAHSEPEAELEAAHVEAVDFEHADFEHADFEDADFEDADFEAAAELEAEPPAEAELAPAAPEPQGGNELDSGAPAPTEPAPEAAEPQLQPRRGFFARLLGRRARQVVVDAEQSSNADAFEEPLRPDTTVDPREDGPAWSEMFPSAPVEPDPAPEDLPELAAAPPALTVAGQSSWTPEQPAQALEQPAEPDPQLPPLAIVGAEAATEPGKDEEATGPDISQELRAAEEVAVEEVTAVLTATLDRLGAAHHRPFSRS